MNDEWMKWKEKLFDRLNYYCQWKRHTTKKEMNNKFFMTLMIVSDRPKWVIKLLFNLLLALFNIIAKIDCLYRNKNQSQNIIMKLKI